jgi:glycosyltransferase domain-containing protein
MTLPEQSAERQVTLMIPTVYGRARLFARVLRYLSDRDFRCPIIVSDHSPTEHLGIITEIANGHGTLDLKVLQHSPALHFLERLTSCARAATTPYVHLHADDDFVLRSMLTRLVQEMERKPDCAAAMGINLHAVFGSRDLTIASKGAIEQSRPFDRLVAQLESYSSVLYALRRRDELIASMTFAAKRCPDVQFWQYLESCVAALAGSIAVVDDLHYVRETHAEKWSSTLVREHSPDHFPYLILSSQFGPRVAAFRVALIDACREREIAIDEGALDDGLIHLLYRGFGTMGLPPKRTAIASDMTQAIAARLWERLAKPADPATVELTRIFAIAKE